MTMKAATWRLFHGVTAMAEAAAIYLPTSQLSIVTETERPERSLAPAPAGKAILTGKRWVILVKLPVAFSGGSKEKSAPDAGAILSTTPSIFSLVNASTMISAFWPEWMLVNWVSLKLA